MYCPKCGKQVPDGAAFCSSCGASLKGGATNSSNTTMIGLIIIFISAILLFWGWPIVKYWDFINFANLQSQPEVQLRLIFLILGITGVICGIIVAVRTSNEIAERNRVSPPPISKADFEKTEPLPQKRAIKAKIKNLNSVIKCSRCGKVQEAERTVCKNCGAEFINRKPR